MGSATRSVTAGGCGRPTTPPTGLPRRSSIACVSRRRETMTVVLAPGTWPGAVARLPGSMTRDRAPWRHDILTVMSGRASAAFVLALAAAFMFALSNVLEQREAEQLPDDESLRAGLLVRLVRRPLWLLGFGADVSGYVCHAAALAFGSLVFVQPLLVTGLLFALLLRAAITG